MLIDRFLHRLERADAARRIEIMRRLVDAYDRAPLSNLDRRSAVTVFTTLLDDPSVRVRRALAEALAGIAEPPSHVVRALAADLPEIAAPLLRAPSVLGEDDLVDCAALGGDGHRRAIAERAHVGAALSAALIEISGADVCLALLRNPGALLPRSALARLAERHGPNADIRTALLARPDLPVESREALVGHVADLLHDMVVTRAWLDAGTADKTIRQARARATLVLADAADRQALGRLVDRLFETELVTPDFLVRALCTGKVQLFALCLQRLTGLPERRIGRLMRDRSGAARRSALAQAGLTSQAVDMLDAVLSAFCEAGLLQDDRKDLALRLRALERAVTALVDSGERQGDSLLPLLYRLSADLNREAARQSATGHAAAA